MKTQLSFLSVALAVTLTACDNKPTVTNLPAAAPQTAPAVAPKPREAEPKVAAPATPQVSEAPKAEIKAAPAAPAAPVKKTVAAERSETEAGLASTTEHARTVTKTQESKARTRAQKAEDEMQEIMAAQKK